MAVDISYTPELLIYRLQEWPSDNEQTKVRREVVEARKLLSYTSVLIDLRGIATLPSSISHNGKVLPRRAHQRFKAIGFTQLF